MATSHDHDSEGAGPKHDPAVDDLALPEAVAEEVAGGDGTPPPVEYTLHRAWPAKQCATSE